MREDDYKVLHESLTSNNDGTTPVECIKVVLPSILGLYYWAGFHALMSQKRVGKTGINDIKIEMIFEFICLVVPCLLCFTVLEDYIDWVITGMLFSCFCFYTYNSSQSVLGFTDTGRKASVARNLMLEFKFDPKRRPYITNFRAITNMLTVLCILAVDFNIFPRRFAKTETFGYGVMDLGVGLFIVSNALVAPEARSPLPVTVSLFKTIVHCLPIVGLGAVRLIVTHLAGYQEHVTEYGKHWNFFFTLAVTRLVCTFVLKVVKPTTPLHSFVISSIILVSYQSILHLGLQDWVLSDAPRDGFVSANREGIASNIGYIALYFASVTLAATMNKWDQRNPLYNTLFMKKLSALALFFWSANFSCEYFVGVSRRLANMGYCIWILTFSVTVILVLLVIERFVLLLKYQHITSREQGPYPNVEFVPNLFDAVNKNGLVYFLNGNLLTGAINLQFQTFLVPSGLALFLLVMYMLLNCSFICFLKYYEFSLSV